MPFPVPANEKQRLRDLHGYDILDTEPEEGFTRICGLAANLLDVPIALINLVDRNRVWIKARVGFEEREFGRDAAFCSHTIMSDDPLIVDDLSRDPVFRHNPLVLGEAGIRFYAGVPLTVRPGVNLGTLCVLDIRSRRLSEKQREALETLGALALEQVRLHRSRKITRNEFKRRMASERLLRQQTLRIARSEALLAQTARLVKVGGWEFSPAGEGLTLSKEAFAAHGVSAGELPDARAVLRLYSRQDRRDLLARARKALRTGEPFDLELPFETSAGAKRWSRIVGEAETRTDGTTRLYGALHDVTDRKLADARIAHLGQHDTLTGLPNRRLFEDHLARALAGARRDGSMLAVLLLDVDEFRAVNDTVGHAAGDALLRGVAEKLRRAVREGDLVARFEGGEFGIMLEHLAQAEDVTRIASSLLDVFRNPVSLALEDLHVGVSAGIAFYPADEEGPGSLLKNADIALSRAKALGGGRYHVFQPALKEVVENRRRVLREVREAIGRDEFTMHYQPLVDLREKHIAGFEALLRWNHPVRGTLAPGVFAAALEDIALSAMIGDTVLVKVLSDIRSWLDAGVEFGRIGVNVSAGQFRTGDLGERIESLLANFGVPASRVLIEVTESVLLDRAVETVGRALAHLDRIGAEVVFDDFGTGYASLTHLKQFPVSWLKIDQSFVRDITRDPGDAAIVRAVVNLGHSLGMRVVAEGVETPEQLHFVSLSGCDAAQGYLFSRPMPAAEVAAYLGDWRPEWAAGVRFVLV